MTATTNAAIARTSFRLFVTEAVYIQSNDAEWAQVLSIDGGRVAGGGSALTVRPVLRGVQHTKGLPRT